MAGKVRVETSGGVKEHKVVSPAEWMAARTAFLAKEKAFSRQGDELAAERRELPWMKIEKHYEFEGPEGKETLAQLFGKKNQLIMYHFMFDPNWEEGCKHCSFWADHYDAAGMHLPARDVSFVVVSRAPLKKLEAFRKRMGWKFKWLSSFGSDFNYDFGVSFTPEQMASGSVNYNFAASPLKMAELQGTSVFYKDEGGAVYRTYSCYARGIDILNGTYHFLDMTPKGRDEEGPKGPQAWVRYHDRYES